MILLRDLRVIGRGTIGAGRCPQLALVVEMGDIQSKNAGGVTLEGERWLGLAGEARSNLPTKFIFPRMRMGKTQKVPRKRIFGVPRWSEVVRDKFEQGAALNWHKRGGSRQPRPLTLSHRLREQTLRQG